MIDLEVIKKRWPVAGYVVSTYKNCTGLLTSAIIDIRALIAELEVAKGRIRELEEDFGEAENALDRWSAAFHRLKPGYDVLKRDSKIKRRG